MELEDSYKDKGDVRGGMVDVSGEVELKAMQELRFKAVNEIKLKVLKGKVEYYGIEMTDPAIFHVLHGRGALFTWKGCVIKLYGKLEACYKSENKVMALYGNLHVALNKLRTEAKVSGGRGPVIMLAGPSDTGKSSVCRLLLNYAVQTAWSPVFVDVDVGQNDISMPAAIGATLVTKPLTPGTLHNLNNTLIYTFGHTTPSNNLPHYHHLISRLADAVDMKMTKDKMYHSSGVVVNTCGWVTGGGFQSLLHTANSFKVDRVVVLGDSRLSSSLTTHLPTTLLPSSSAVVLRDKEERYQSRQRRLHSFLFHSHHPTSKYSHPNHPTPNHPNHPKHPTPNHPLHPTLKTQTTMHSFDPASSHLNPNCKPFIPAHSKPPHPNQPTSNQPTSNQPTFQQTHPKPDSLAINPFYSSMPPSIPSMPSSTPIHPPVFVVSFNKLKVFMLNDNIHQYKKARLLPLRITNQHTRMVVALADSPDHLANRPIRGIALILEVKRDEMLLMTLCASRPTCMLLMPSLHYRHPIPPSTIPTPPSSQLPPSSFHYPHPIPPSTIPTPPSSQ